MVLVLVLGGSSHPPHRVAAGAGRANAGAAPGSPASGSGASTTPSTTAQTTSTTSTTSPGGGSATSTYSGTDFTAQIPAGWQIQENGAPEEGFIESKWRSPSNHSDFVLVDVSPQTARTPEQQGAPVRKDLSRLSSYTEVFWGPGNLPGEASWEWTFKASGDERVDYFFSACGNDIAVLGSSGVSRFTELVPTFTSFAGSVRGAC